jgi:enoyl-[acyl-carrier protein] reductase/trans-2-enoyl-CoA reductase (NAD+)
LFTGSVPRRKEIRIDDWEMRPDVQEKITACEATTENIAEISDLEGYRRIS